MKGCIDMNKNTVFKRKICEATSKDQKRRTHKYSVTDTEYDDIQRMYRREGFDNLRDYLVYQSRQNPERAVNAQNRYQQLVIQINALATHVNKIESGIDVAAAQFALQEGVKTLCLSYRL